MAVKTLALGHLMLQRDHKSTSMGPMAFRSNLPVSIQHRQVLSAGLVGEMLRHKELLAATQVRCKRVLNHREVTTTQPGSTVMRPKALYRNLGIFIRHSRVHQTTGKEVSVLGCLNHVLNM